MLFFLWRRLGLPGAGPKCMWSVETEDALGFNALILLRLPADIAFCRGGGGPLTFGNFFVGGGWESLGSKAVLGKRGEWPP